MFSKPSASALRRLRSLLARLEQTAEPCYDAETLESIKTLVRNHIAAIEAVQPPATEAPESPPNERAAAIDR